MNTTKQQSSWAWDGCHPPLSPTRPACVWRFDIRRQTARWAPGMTETSWGMSLFKRKRRTARRQMDCSRDPAPAPGHQARRASGGNRLGPSSYPRPPKTWGGSWSHWRAFRPVQARSAGLSHCRNIRSWQTCWQGASPHPPEPTGEAAGGSDRDPTGPGASLRVGRLSSNRRGRGWASCSSGNVRRDRGGLGLSGPRPSRANQAQTAWPPPGPVKTP